MPVKVTCPSCGKELNAPDELVGQRVACPRCSNRFQVDAPSPTAAAAQVRSAGQIPPNLSVQDNMMPPVARSRKAAVSSDSSVVPLPPSAANAAQAKPETISVDAAPANNPPVEPPAANSAATSDMLPPVARPTAKPGTPATATAPPQADPPVTKTARFKGAPSATPVAPPTASPAPATPTAPPQAPATSAAPVKKKKREVKKAKFVASGAVSTRINLGEDGKLPELIVSDTKSANQESQEEADTSTSPMLMIGVLLFSVVVSVAMLMMPEDADQAESTSKQKAVDHIEKWYIGLKSDLQPIGELKPYQKLLRRGLQARRRGDQQAANAAFREVLDMLRAESMGDRGVTSEYKWAEYPPNDSDLEDHLKVLLAD